MCKSTTGVHIRLTRADFASDEEFLYWKDWSDEDYSSTAKEERKFTESCVALIDTVDSLRLTIEDELLLPLEKKEQANRRANLVEQIKMCLTEKQYRRLFMYYLEGLTESEIAALEGVGQRRISTSLTSGKKALKKILKNFL